MTIPTREEINVYDSLDERAACKHFLGKSIEEAEALLRENCSHYVWDLMWMGPWAFCYYLYAAIRYIQSEDAKGDSDMVSCFASLLEFRLEHELDELRPVSQALADVCARILAEWPKFDASPDHCGDLRGRYEVLTSTFLRLAAEIPSAGT